MPGRGPERSGRSGIRSSWGTDARRPRHGSRRHVGPAILDVSSRQSSGLDRQLSATQQVFRAIEAGTIAKSGQSLRMARSAVRLQAHIRSAAAMLVAPLIRRRPIAVFRSVAITRGAFPVLMVDASSR